MKAKFTICFLIATAFLFMSNSGGRGTVGMEAVTGAPGENGRTCANSGCHAAGNFDPSLVLSFKDENGEEIGSWEAGKTYDVSLFIDATGSPEGYGFQMVSLTENDNGALNNWSDFDIGTGEVTLLGRQYVEHKQRLENNTINLKWTAPDVEGTGDVAFYVSANAVNGNGSPAMDGATTRKIVLEETVISNINELENELEIFPNPATDFVNISGIFENISTYQLVDILGNEILNGKITNRIDINSVKNGVYFLQLLSTDYQEKITRKLIVK